MDKPKGEGVVSPSSPFEDLDMSLNILRRPCLDGELGGLGIGKTASESGMSERVLTLG